MMTLSLLQPILSIFQYDFMVRAIGVGIIIAVITPLIGQFLVMRRLSLISDALAHIALAGATIGFALGVSPLVSSIVATTLGSGSIEWLRRKDKKINETALALFLFGSLGISVIVASINGGSNKILSFLFGSISTVSQSDVIAVMILGAIILIFCLLFFRFLFTLYYDEEYARSSGIQNSLISLFFTFFVAITICFSLQIVGTLLVGGLMTIPVVSAMRFSKSFLENTIFSIIFAVTAVLSGLVVGFALNVPTGGLIILILIIQYILSFILTMEK